MKTSTKHNIITKSIGLLTIGLSSAKFGKSQKKFRVLNAGQYLSAGKISGKNMCPDMSPECEKLCLKSSGHGEDFLLHDGHHIVNEARLRRTMHYLADMVLHVDQLKHEVKNLVIQGKRKKLKVAMRPNATSDQAWERLLGSNGKNLFNEFPAIQFYDYTKSQKRALAYINGDMPKNYYLTFSLDERPESLAFALAYLAMGGCIALCAKLSKKSPVPNTFHGFPCLDGDTHDLRYLDPMGSVVVLRPKGSKALAAAKSGFVIFPENWVN